MLIQIINYNLRDATEQRYLELCEELAPTIEAMPGLVVKVWLADAETNTYGGVYVWRDRAAMEAFMSSEVVALVMSHPQLANITSKEFGILDAPTHVIRGFSIGMAR